MSASPVVTTTVTLRRAEEPQKRANPSPSTSKRPFKRVKRAVHDDTDREATAAVIAEASGDASYISSRPDPTADSTMPSLALCSLNALAQSFRSMYINRATGEWREDVDLASLKLLPANIASRLLEGIIASTPADAPLNLSIISLFLSAVTTSFTLGGSQLRIPVKLLDQLKACPHLTHLDLSHQKELTDRQLAAVLPSMRLLETVKLKGCTQVGDGSVVALAVATEDRLKEVDLSYTSATTKGLTSLLPRCKNLEVLKLAFLNRLNDFSVQYLITASLEAAVGWRHVPLSRLRKLNLGHTAIADAAVGRLLSLTPLLETLDISYTDVKSLDFIIPAIPTSTWSIRKLVLSGLKLKRSSLERFLKSLSLLPDDRRSLLRTLKIGSMGLGRHEAVLASTAVDLDSLALSDVLPYLESFSGLEKLSLHGNTALDRRPAVLSSFFSIVGYRLKWLDLTSVRLSSKMLEGLEELRQTDAVLLETVLLNNCRVDDEALKTFGACKRLKELHLESAKITEEGLLALMDDCPALSVLYLKGCRGLKVRTDWFEAYEQGRIGRSPSPEVGSRSRRRVQ